MTDLPLLSAIEMRRRILAGELSPVELLNAVRARVERLDPHLNAFVETCWDRAAREAVAAEAAARDGDRLHPLHGLPIAVKESQDVEGLHTTLGSTLYADRVATQDALTVAAIRAAGGIIVGKTNVPELLNGGTSRNTVYGLTRNAHHPGLSCLGSSGGSAVALSTDSVPLATGSDTGGSIRGPSAANGTAGLRPSPGLIANPALPNAFGVSSVLGPMARSIADVMLLLAGMVCSSHLDPFDWNPDTAPLLDPVPADPSTLRIAVSADLGCVNVAGSVRDRFEEVVAVIAPRVGRVARVTPELGAIAREYHVLRTLIFLLPYGEQYATARERLTPQANADLRRGYAASARMMAEATRAQTAAYRSLATLMRDHDVLITPGASEPVPTLAEVDRREAALRADNARFAPDEADFTRLPPPSINTPITWTAHPVATVTAGRGRDGMPFGLNLVGRHRDDIRLLRIALAIEGILGAEGLNRPRPDLSWIATEPPA